MNDQFEREIEIIKNCLPHEIRDHYGLTAEWKIRISDSQAINFGLSEFFALGLIVITLIYACRSPQAGVGDIFALFRYVSVFTLSLSNIPLLVAEFS